MAGLVQRARQAVIFTGAGISTDSGIPDFRSPGGFWTRHKPIAFKEFTASAETRLTAWRRFFVIHDTMIAAEPGRAHNSVAALMARGHVGTVITQNIDDLHGRAGVPRGRIIEIHGSGTHARCLSCAARHEISWVRAHIDASGAPPACSACGGILKSATISFGQSMPEQAMAQARAATLNADLFLAIGSSLQVFPAAGFPVAAKQNQTPLVIINREPTGLDAIADLVINDDIGDVLAGVLALVAP